MEKESTGKRGIGVGYKGSQGQTERTVELQEEEEDHELAIFSTLAGKGLRTETWRNNMQAVSFHDHVTPQSIFVWVTNYLHGMKRVSPNATMWYT
jgi:hypothetical protein